MQFLRVALESHARWEYVLQAGERLHEVPSWGEDLREAPQEVLSNTEIVFGLVIDLNPVRDTHHRRAEVTVGSL